MITKEGYDDLLTKVAQVVSPYELTEDSTDKDRIQLVLRIMSTERSRWLVVARKLFTAFTIEKNKSNSRDIARFLHRDRSTIYYYADRIPLDLYGDNDFKKVYQELENLID